MTSETPTQEPEWRRDPRIVPVVNILRKDWDPAVQQAVDKTDCFGLYVLPEDGTSCEHADKCELASYCKRTYEISNVAAAQAVTAPIITSSEIVPTPSTPPRLLVDPTVKKPKSQPKQKSQLEASKYMRIGYEPCGRHVDALLAEFKKELPALPTLPLVWNQANFAKKFGSLGVYTVAATASYHTILQEGLVLCRFWTNSVKTAMFDFLPELKLEMAKASKRLGTYRYRKLELLQLEAPYAVPPASWPKLRPCTHRVIVRTPDAARAVARVIRDHWSIT